MSATLSGAAAEEGEEGSEGLGGWFWCRAWGGRWLERSRSMWWVSVWVEYSYSYWSSSSLGGSGGRGGEDGILTWGFGGCAGGLRLLWRSCSAAAVDSGCGGAMWSEGPGKTTLGSRRGSVGVAFWSLRSWNRYNSHGP